MFKCILLTIPPILFMAIIGSIVYFAIQSDNRTIRYDCSIAEISPDFPIEVREACRKKLSGRI